MYVCTSNQQYYMSFIMWLSVEHPHTQNVRTCTYTHRCTIQHKILKEGNFDGYWLFKYLTENILIDGYCLSPYTCKCCIIFKQLDRLNFDGLVGKHQKCQNFPLSQNFVLYDIHRQTQHTQQIHVHMNIHTLGEIVYMTTYHKQKLCRRIVSWLSWIFYKL